MGWYVVNPVKAQSHDTVSCNPIAVIKADSGKRADYHFEIEKGCEDIGVKEILKEMYLTDFSEACLKDADPFNKGRSINKELLPGPDLTNQLVVIFREDKVLTLKKCF